MRKLSKTCVLVIGIFYGLFAHVTAQNSQQKWGIGVGYSYRDFNGIPNNDFSDTEFKGALRLIVGRYLSPSFDLSLESILTPVNFDFPRSLNDLTDFDLNLKYKLNNGKIFNQNAVVAPYLSAGFGANVLDWDEGDMNFSVPVGVGFRIPGNAPVSLDLSAIYKPSISDFNDYIALNAGVIIGLGKIVPPDADGDGILDDQDRCPNDPGPAFTQGCPDRDGDGIADMSDNCPEVPGVAILQGCPEKKDADNDGIADADDACPNVAGPASLQGCPDQDGDGIADKDDECPTLAGPPNTQGCPDRDGDGITDPKDNCPDEVGPVNLNGCPDRDGDQVIDKEDKCPDEAGTVELLGCPEVAEEVKEKLEFATQNVQFQTSSATLKSSSLSIMDEIVTILNDYPEYKLRISGHTDSIGPADKNQALSEKRAKACVDYLITKGINADRLQYIGYGETQPIADNINEAGRSQNRRVEFDLYVE